jgi:hypothetical protein
MNYDRAVALCRQVLAAQSDVAPTTLADNFPPSYRIEPIGGSMINVTNRDATFTLDVETRSVTIWPTDRCFSIRELRDLLAMAMDFEHDIDDETWEAAERLIGWDE